MADAALQIELTSAAPITTGERVVFNTIVSSSGNISYDNEIGEISLLEAGRYLVNWWMATQTSTSANGTVFALSSSQGDLLEGTSPIRTGEVYGVGVIDVLIAPVTLSLINSSTATIYLSGQTSLQGSLVVTPDNPSGELGPTGPTGADGTIGPTGPTGSTGELSQNMFRARLTATAILPVLTSADIDWSTSTGLTSGGITISGSDLVISEPGTYYVAFETSLNPVGYTNTGTDILSFYIKQSDVDISLSSVSVNVFDVSAGNFPDDVDIAISSLFSVDNALSNNLIHIEVTSVSALSGATHYNIQGQQTGITIFKLSDSVLTPF